jgi:carbonic anhydrase
MPTWHSKKTQRIKTTYHSREAIYNSKKTIKISFRQNTPTIVVKERYSFRNPDK